MALVTNAEVQALVVNTDVDMTPFIETADLIVTESLASAGLTSDRLKQIELYLSGHFYILSYERGGLTKELIGEAEERYRIIPDDQIGLAQTRFGQQAMALDTSGTLAATMGTTPTKALFRVV